MMGTMGMKTEVGITLPLELAEGYHEIAASDGVGGKQKWLVASAAMVALLSLSESQRHAIYRCISEAAGPGGSMTSLMDRCGVSAKVQSILAGQAEAEHKTVNELLSDMLADRRKALRPAKKK
jgi:hypothetical protein